MALPAHDGIDAEPCRLPGEVAVAGRLARPGSERAVMDLLEREPHLGQLTEHFRQATEGHGRLVLIGGEAGAGKTALVDAFCRRVAAPSAVLRASCDALSTPAPLAPLRDLAPALGIPTDWGSPDGEARDRLFRAVLASLAASSAPIVLVGEDAHWADGASLEFLRFLGRRIATLPVLAVVTYRDDELGADHPLRLVMGDLATAPTVYRMSIPPLSPWAVERLAEGSGQNAAAVHRLTGGNPFFATEVLAAGSATVPATVGDAVLARAARLSSEARAVLDIAAVIGSTVDPDLLLAVAGPALDQTDECIARGLLRGTGDGLAFRHELAREAILGAIAPTRRRQLHARVLAGLRAGSAGQPDPARLAHHAEAAGDRIAVLEFATAAAEQAAALHAHREAAAQFKRALDVGDALPTDERARLLEGRSIACYLSDHGEDAIAARQAAVEIRRRRGDVLAEGDGLRWLSRFYWYQGLGAEAEDAAMAAQRLLETAPPGPELAMAYSNLAQLRMLAPDQEETLRWGGLAIDLAERLGESAILAHALTNIGTVRLEQGDERGRPDLERAVAIAFAGGHVDHACRALVNLACAALATARFDEAEHRLAAGIAYATDHDLDSYRRYLVALKADLDVRRGAWDAALAAASALLTRPATSPLTRFTALTVVGRVLARRGDATATALLDEALALAEPTGELYRLAPARAARAEAALLANDPAQAIAEVRSAYDIVLARGNRWYRGEAALLLWRAGVADVPTPDLAEPYALEISGDWEAAASAWAALGCPYEEAQALAGADDPAAVRRAITTFERLGARPALAHAIRRLRSLGVRDVPPVRRGPRRATRANPAGLTAREVEVLALVTEGLGNAAIADRLYLTPKTVGHHVSAILAKLGVANRAEAARAAAQLGIGAS